MPHRPQAERPARLPASKRLSGTGSPKPLCVCLFSLPTLGAVVTHSVPRERGCWGLKPAFQGAGAVDVWGGVA